ncbi:hypothetical protein, partial [Gordonia paraffinivorans]|uniref:hypothetical protein n=1 Tax=Gordonia paraffinivorans TaxID=175628 RepID=UPI00242FACF9
ETVRAIITAMTRKRIRYTNVPMTRNTLMSFRVRRVGRLTGSPVCQAVVALGRHRVGMADGTGRDSLSSRRDIDSVA